MVFAEGVKLIHAHTSRSSSLEEDVLTVAEQAGHPQRVRWMDLAPEAQRVDRQSARRPAGEQLDGTDLLVVLNELLTAHPCLPPSHKDEDVALAVVDEVGGGGERSVVNPDLGVRRECGDHVEVS